MASRANFPVSLRTDIREYIDAEFTAYEPLYPKVFHVGTSTRQSEVDAGLVGIGNLVETAELGPVTYEDPIEIPKTTYVHKKYTKGIQVSSEAVDDDQQGVWQRRAKMLGRASARAVDTYAFSVFRNAFNTSFTGFDGDPLCSTLHTPADGGTDQSNASATGVVLSEPNLEIAWNALQEIKDDQGNIVAAGLGDLVLMVPPKLRKEALAISQSELVPQSANNDINVYRGIFTVVVNPYISALQGATETGGSAGSDTAWFLLSPNEHFLNVIMRQQPTLEDETDFDTANLKVKITMRFSFGWSHWVGVWGSKGDGAAYAS